MTAVFGKKINETILIVGDTRISNAHGTVQEVIPGRLKIYVLSDGLTVAFAGNAGLAHSVLTDLWKHRKELSEESILVQLTQLTVGGEVDFIVASHAESASLWCLRRGARFKVDDYCYIGEVVGLEGFISKLQQSGGDETSTAKNIWGDFAHQLMKLEGVFGGSVGGVPIGVLCRESNHNYLAIEYVNIFKFPTLNGESETHEPLEYVTTGEGHFRFEGVPPLKSGVPVFGLLLAQPKAGFIYSPVESNLPLKVELDAPDNWPDVEHNMGDQFSQAIAMSVATVLAT